MSAWKAATLLVCTAGLWWALSTLAAEPPRVAFVRPPAYVSAEAPVTLVIRVPPHAENRQLLLAVLDGEFLMSGTERDLQGDRSAPIHNVTVHLPAGELVLRAGLYGTGGRQIAVATARVTVVGR